MSHVAILTDSTADLSQELLERTGVRVVPLTVNFDDEAYKDGVEIDTRRLFELVGQKKKLPKTASPSPAEFQAAFAEATGDGSEALFIGISTKFSATVQNALIARDLLPDRRVTVFDSQNLSTGIGLQVMYAADLAREGKSAAEIVAALEGARSKVRTAFVIDTLEYLHMGGRCSGVTALLGSLLRIRPIISVVDGGMAVGAKVRGPRHKALDTMLESFAQDVQQGLVRPDRVFITHTGVHEDAAYMADQVRQLFPEVREVLETAAGSVVGSHCGPGTIGVLYMLK